MANRIISESSAALPCTSIIATNDECRRGALECMSLLRDLAASASSLPPNADDASIFYRIQSQDAAKLASAFGLTPRQEGAFRALAEYIHVTMTTGEPNLDAWLPLVAETDDQVKERIDLCRALYA